MKKLLQFLLLSFGILAIKYFLSVTIAYVFPTYTSNLLNPVLNNSTQIEGEFPTYRLSEIWNKQHSVHFVDVAVNGYRSEFPEEGEAVNWSFYPLYPLLISGFVNVFPVFENVNQYYVIGAVLSSVFFGLALYFLDKLLEMLYLHDDKKYFVYLLLFTFPGSYVFNLIYSESLFLLLVVLSLYLLFSKKYMGAFSVLGLAVSTRIIGVVMLVPYIYYFVINERFNKKVKVLPKSLFFTSAALSPLLFFYYHLFSKTGDFFAAFRAKGNVLDFMYIPFGYFFNYFQRFGVSFHPVYALNLVILLMSIAALVYIFIRLFLVFEFRSTEQIALFVFMATYVLAMSALSAEAPLVRYFSVCIPAYLLLAITSTTYVRSIKFLTIALISLSVQIIYFVMFLVGVPVYM